MIKSKQPGIHVISKSIGLQLHRVVLFSLCGIEAENIDRFRRRVGCIRMVLTNVDAEDVRRPGDVQRLQ